LDTEAKTRYSADKPPRDWDEFLARQTEIHVQKDHDYDSRFMRGLMKHGRPIWEWEVEKKLDRIRTWLTRGELQVKGEGLNNAVGDLFNYTVQFLIYLKAVEPLSALSERSFFQYATRYAPHNWIALLVNSGLIQKNEIALQNIIRLYMGDNPTKLKWQEAIKAILQEG